MHSCFTKILIGTEGKFFPETMLFYSGKVFGQWWPTISACLKRRDFSAYRAFGAKTRAVSGELGGLVAPCGPPIAFSKFSWRRGPFHPSLFCPTDFSDSYYFTACSFILLSILWSEPWAQLSKKKTTSLKDILLPPKSGNVCLMEILDFVRVPTFPCMCIPGASG